jgi:hypothetical protein
MGFVVSVVVVLVVVFSEQLLAAAKSAYSFLASKLPAFGGIFGLKVEFKAWKALVLLAFFYFVQGGIKLPEFPKDWKLPSWPVVVETVKADRATYVFEQRAGDISPAIKAAISKLNEKGILATPFDKDTVDKQGGETPEQYKVALDAAKVLPSLVIQGGPKVIKVIEKPTAEQVEAVQ